MTGVYLRTDAISNKDKAISERIDREWLRILQRAGRRVKPSLRR
jgi:hypothetical protein